jgi:uncharacterized protein
LLDGQAKGVTEALKQTLAQGLPIEIAGYTLSSALALGMGGALLAPPAPLLVTPKVRRVEWMELSTREDASLSPISAKTIEQWQSAGAALRSQIVNGPAFWQTTEIEEAPLLLAASVEALAEQPSLKAVA